MFQDRLDDITAYIMEHNTYFNVGFSNVYLDEKTGFVANDGVTKIPVFPADELGDYFYLRLPNNVAFVSDAKYSFSNCITGLGIRSTVILVACIKTNGSDKLLENIVVTLRNYSKADIVLRSAIYQKDIVTLQELSKISESEQDAALQRLGDYGSIVSVTFDITENVLSHKLSCIEPPCNC